jgi:hypothetical protein
METEEKSGKQREITYQIGWKKGKIQKHDPNQSAVDAKRDQLTKSMLFRLHKHIIWRVAPAAPKSWLFPILYLLPALVFMLTFVLVYQLSHF